MLEEAFFDIIKFKEIFDLIKIIENEDYNFFNQIN